MTCRHIRTYLVPFLKGALDVVAADRVRAHLSACPCCARESAYLEPAVALLAPLRLAVAQTDQRGLVEMVQAQAVGSYRRWQRRVWRWAVVAAATAAVAAAVIVSRLPGTTPGGGSAPAASALRPGDVGMIAQTFGAPRIRARHAEWRAAKRYRCLRLGDELRTGEGQTLDLWFTDGSRMRIGPRTRVALLRPGWFSKRPVIVRLDRGSASVAVMKAQSRFAVRTPAATATATGTRFGLDVAPSGRTNLAVFSGSVVFANEFGTVTAAGPVRTMAAAGSAPSAPVSIGMQELLDGAPGVLRDDFSTPPLNEAVWIRQGANQGVLVTQEPGYVLFEGSPRANPVMGRAWLVTYFFPRQDFSAAVSFRIGADAEGGAELGVGDSSAAGGLGDWFQPDMGYGFMNSGCIKALGDERRAFHRLRLVYKAATGSLTGYVDQTRIMSPVVVRAPYFFLGFGPTSRRGARVHVEFKDFEAQFAGGVPELVAPQPTAAPLATKVSSAALDVGAPDAWDGLAVYNPSVIKRDGHYEMWYAANPPDGTWSESRIGLADSDDGVTWRSYGGNPVIEEPGMGAPCVVHGDWRDGKGPYYKMWYRCYEPSWRATKTPSTRLAYATSRDGRHWTRHGTIAGARREEGFGHRMTSPSVLYLPDEPGLPAPYLLYYYANEDDVRLAVSQDGIHWQPRGPVLTPSAPGRWDSSNVGDGHVVYVGGKFHLFYGGYGSDPRLGSAIGYAVSDDGIHFRRANRLAVAGSNDPGAFDFGLTQPAALVDGNTIRIWYTCGPYSGLFGFWGHNIGYAQMRASDLARVSTIPAPVTTRSEWEQLGPLGQALSGFHSAAEQQRFDETLAALGRSLTDEQKRQALSHARSPKELKSCLLAYGSLSPAQQRLFREIPVPLLEPGYSGKPEGITIWNGEMLVTWRTGKSAWVTRSCSAP